MLSGQERLCEKSWLCVKALCKFYCCVLRCVFSGDGIEIMHSMRKEGLKYIAQKYIDCQIAQKYILYDLMDKRSKVAMTSPIFISISCLSDCYLFIWISCGTSDFTWHFFLSGTHSGSSSLPSSWPRVISSCCIG